MQLYTRTQRGLNIAQLNETSESVPSGHGNHRNKAVTATVRFVITLVLLAQVHKLHAYTHTHIHFLTRMFKHTYTYTTVSYAGGAQDDGV